MHCSLPTSDFTTNTAPIDMTGPFQIFYMFTPKIGEDSHFDSYFSDGLKPATRILCLSCLFMFFPIKLHILAKKNLFFREMSSLILPQVAEKVTRFSTIDSMEVSGSGKR